MASLAHHLPSLFLIISLLYTTSTNGNPGKPSNIACPSFRCGNGLVIGYPFWQQDQQNLKDHYCGYPGLGISCSTTGQQPMLRLSDHLYRLKTINNSENTLTATYFDEPSDKTCPIARHGVNINTSTSLEFTVDNKVVHFFYNCTLYPPSLRSIACLEYSSKRSYVFMEGAIPEFDWKRFCDSTVNVPVVEKAVLNGILASDFGRALRDGFELMWRSPDSACRSCEATGGFCGYSNSGLRHKFICFCSQGRQSGHCHDEGESTLASEPNFIAIGALICGCLIIVAATIFYLTRKKKSFFQKPAFSRIPTSTK